MANDLNLALVLQLVDKMTKPLKGATTQANAAVGGLGKTAKDSTKAFDGLTRVVNMFNGPARKAAESATDAARAVEMVNRAFGRSKEPARESADTLEKISKVAALAARNMRDVAHSMATMGGNAALAGMRMAHQSALSTMEEFRGLKGVLLAAGGAATILAPIRAYAELEDATNSLEMTLMNAHGKLHPLTRDVKDLAVSLGQQLPGTSKDYIKGVDEMLKSGISVKDILDGAGKAGAFLNIAIGNDPSQAGETGKNFARTAELLDVHGAKDLMSLADIIQKAQHLGINPEEFQESLHRSGVKSQNFNGMKDGAEWLRLLVYSTKMMGSGFVGGSSARALMDDFNQEKHLAKANAALAAHGMRLDMFDEHGNSKGLPNFIAQLSKLQSLDMKQRRKIVTMIAGPGGEDAQLMLALIKNGSEKLAEFNKNMDDQGDIAQRVGHKQEDLSTKLANLSGNITNLLAQMGDTFGTQIKNLVDKLSEWTNNVQAWLKTNKDSIVALCNWMVNHLVASIGILLTAVVAAKGSTAVAGSFWNWFKNQAYGKTGKFGQTIEAQRVYVTNWPKGGIGPDLPGGGAATGAENEGVEEAAKKGWLSRSWSWAKGVGGAAVGWMARSRLLGPATGRIVPYLMSDVGTVTGAAAGGVTATGAAITGGAVLLAGAGGYGLGAGANWLTNDWGAHSKNKWGVANTTWGGHLYDWLNEDDLDSLREPVRYKHRRFNQSSPTPAPVQVDTSGTLKIQLDVKNNTGTARWQPNDPAANLRLDSGMILPGIGGG